MVELRYQIHRVLQQVKLRRDIVYARMAFFPYINLSKALLEYPRVLRTDVIIGFIVLTGRHVVGRSKQ